MRTSSIAIYLLEMTPFLGSSHPIKLRSRMSSSDPFVGTKSTSEPMRWKLGLRSDFQVHFRGFKNSRAPSDVPGEYLRSTKLVNSAQKDGAKRRHKKKWHKKMAHCHIHVCSCSVVNKNEFDFFEKNT